MAYTEWQQVESSNLHAIRYNMDTLVLEIEFNTGFIYQYFDVPNAVYYELANAGSKGTYFHAHIKDIYRTAKH